MKNTMVTRNILKSIYLLFVLLFTWFIFEDKSMQIFDEKILPLLTNMKFSAITNILFFLIILLPIYGIYKCVKNRFYIPYQTFVLLSFIVFIYIRHRSSGGYISIPSTILGLGYTDIGIILLLIFLIACLFSFCNNYHKKSDNENYAFIPDTPISNPAPEIDILEYSENAKCLAKDLENIQVETSYSIGLIAPWGTGKTSYLNLLEYYLDRNKFIVLNFNPRNSRSTKNIQEDFFDELFSKLGSYDSRFSSTFKDYLKAIDIVNENKIISFLFNIHKIWNKEEEKEQINNAILRLNKKIIVIIEDFDRLLSDEIIEVFKLIDGNASFSNIIFITAYDKKHINHIIGEAYSNEESLFSDKFFTIEIQIPLRPYDKIFSYIEKQLLAGINISTENEDLYRSTLKHHLELLKKYIITLRDAKRFLNLFIRQYIQVKGEVEFKDYFLLYLIKYKYLDEYLKLYKKDIVSINFLEYSNRMVLNNYSDMKSKDILEILFPSETSPNRLRSINNAMAFDIYFHENVYGHLKLAEMEQVFDVGKDCRQIIQGFISRNAIQDFISFLDAKNILVLQTKEKFEQYVDAWLYLYINNHETTISHFKILALIYVQYSKEIRNNYQYTEEEYKYFISNKLQGLYPEYPYGIVRSIIMGIINDEFNEEIIYSKEDIQRIAIAALENLIKKDEDTKQIHIELLYNCMSDINQTSRIITLSQEACLKVKGIIEKNPSGYFKNFVRLGMVPINKDVNTIACEPFWLQIFNDKNIFEQFIENLNENSVPNIDLIKNFWRLYKNNNYKPIDFQNQGNVQKKIENNLVEETSKLDLLLKIEREFYEHEIDRNKTPHQSNKDSYLELYKKLLSRIDSIGFYITKTGDIKREINNAISLIS